jgi:hypothetical protein
MVVKELLSRAVGLIHLAPYRSMRWAPLNRVIALVSVMCGKFLE